MCGRGVVAESKVRCGRRDGDLRVSVTEFIDCTYRDRSILQLARNDGKQWVHKACARCAACNWGRLARTRRTIAKSHVVVTEHRDSLFALHFGPLDILIYDLIKFICIK